MNENLDLTKILNGCPKGTKFYSSVYGVVEFADIDYIDQPAYPIRIKTELGGYCVIANDGRTHNAYKGECTFFPSKEQRDWSRFERFWDKPKANKFDPKTLQPFDKVLARTGIETWVGEIYNYKADGYVVCVGGCYRECIPYNEETKHLLGTTKDCPDCYKWWEKEK